MFGDELGDGVGGLGELGDVGLAAGAPVDVEHHLGPLGTAQDPERELRCQLPHLGAGEHAHSVRSSTSTARNRISALRIRVLAVPSGMPSISPTSRAV